MVSMDTMVSNDPSLLAVGRLNLCTHLGQLGVVLLMARGGRGDLILVG